MLFTSEYDNGIWSNVKIQRKSKSSSHSYVIVPLNSDKPSESWKEQKQANITSIQTETLHKPAVQSSRSGVCVKQWRTLQVKTHEWKAEDGWINWKGFRLTGKLKSDEKCSLRISLFLIGLVKCLGMG